MTVREARAIAKSFDENTKTGAEEEFLYIEAMNYLIEEENKPRDMMVLGGYYYEIKEFELALKYYDMAAAMDYDEAYECLGYIWYYGRTGKRDYKKAFENFYKMMEKGHLVATYKVADMYKNGYYVEKSQERYEEIIEDMYPRVSRCKNVFDPIPEVYTRLARIRTSQGRIEDALNLYLVAKRVLAQRISYNAFWGNLNIMKWLIDDMYELTPFDYEDFDFYDLFYLLKSPNKIMFRYKRQIHTLESVLEGEECTVCFDGKWYRSRDDFYKQAQIEGVAVTALYREIYDFELAN